MVVAEMALALVPLNSDKRNQMFLVFHRTPSQENLAKKATGAFASEVKVSSAGEEAEEAMGYLEIQRLPGPRFFRLWP